MKNTQKLLFLSLFPTLGFAFSSESSITYTVKSGDSLAVIAKKLNRSGTRNEFLQIIDSVTRLNKLKNINLIHPGQLLKLPNLEKKYIVQKGDSFFEIISKFHPKQNPYNFAKSYEAQNNHIKNFNRLEVGQTINLLGKNQKKASVTKQNREISSISSKIDSNLHLEMKNIDKKEAKVIINTFNRILNSRKKEDLLVSLKELLDLSRVLEKDLIETNSLRLISKVIRSKSDSEYLPELKVFFKTWKSARLERAQY